MRTGYALPGGWIFRQRYPLVNDDPMVEFVIEHPDKGDHHYTIDRAMLAADNTLGFEHLYEWAKEVMGDASLLPFPRP